MREYQVSYGKYVSKRELPSLLKELGYNAVNEGNAKEVFEKIAEIMSRKI